MNPVVMESPQIPYFKDINDKISNELIKTLISEL